MSVEPTISFSDLFRPENRSMLIDFLGDIVRDKSCRPFLIAVTIIIILFIMTLINKIHFLYYLTKVPLYKKTIATYVGPKFDCYKYQYSVDGQIYEAISEIDYGDKVKISYLKKNPTEVNFID